MARKDTVCTVQNASSTSHRVLDGEREKKDLRASGVVYTKGPYIKDVRTEGGRGVQELVNFADKQY